MEKTTVKKVNERDVLNGFYNHWLDTKIATEIDLAYNLSSSILLKDLSTAVSDQMKQRKSFEELITRADKYLKIIDDKLKEL